uniref:Putative secreted protein n=1 Tax=Anopheles marajoara TaxID=58244 RepID=A0A2M4CBF8_9DIPT
MYLLHVAANRRRATACSALIPIVASLTVPCRLAQRTSAVPSTLQMTSVVGVLPTKTRPFVSHSLTVSLSLSRSLARTFTTRQRDAG